MYLMIDNYDSFVYNLERYLEELGEKVKLVRNDQITMEQINTLLTSGRLSGIILSPGPKSPADCGRCKEILAETAGKVPVLGVCLGHQIIGHVFGAKVKKGIRPMHGKVTDYFRICLKHTMSPGIIRWWSVTRIFPDSFRSMRGPRMARSWPSATEICPYMESSFTRKQY